MSSEIGDISRRLEIDGCCLWELPTIVDSRGQLVVAEFAAMPFPVKRAFFVSHVPAGQLRGASAHKSGSELLIAIKGSLTVAIDDGTRRIELVLRRPDCGLVVGPRIWCVQSRFSEDAVLAVLASCPYDPDDLVRDYVAFRSMVTGA